jgi:hypothetical protein
MSWLRHHDIEAKRTHRPALACVPGAIDDASRPAHFALSQRLFNAQARERRVLQDPQDGYEFRFDSDVFGDLATFIGNERRCCPFLDFTLDVAADNGAIWLTMSGPQGTRELLDAELFATE